MRACVRSAAVRLCGRCDLRAAVRRCGARRARARMSSHAQLIVGTPVTNVLKVIAAFGLIQGMTSDLVCGRPSCFACCSARDCVTTRSLTACTAQNVPWTRGHYKLVNWMPAKFLILFASVRSQVGHSMSRTTPWCFVLIRLANQNSPDRFSRPESECTAADCDRRGH